MGAGRLEGEVAIVTGSARGIGRASCVELAREVRALAIRVTRAAPGFARSNPAAGRQWQALGIQGQRRPPDSIGPGGWVSPRTSRGPWRSSRPTTPAT